ncbi:hypothetical protein NA78x_003423 [Anatilimnocola sp. NA78]|uniref:D-alanine--D-alanine ligase family protein n=1 Tax=Anatilimnocola sp. NA78 TaxID=3415683 RepID=UPI003CE4914A
MPTRRSHGPGAAVHESTLRTKRGGTRFASTQQKIIFLSYLPDVSHMRITVLAYQEPDDESPDIVVPQVAEALDQLGHAVSCFAITEDVGKLVQGVRDQKPDLIFNLMESFGDDVLGGLMGVTGVLDLLEIPYTGGGPGEIYLQEDKALSKKLLAYEQVLYPDFASFAPNADFETGGKLRMPLFVKPLRMDGSVGIVGKESLVKNASELMERVLSINKELGDSALAEEYIDGREFYVGILGNMQPQTFVPIEMDFSGFTADMPRVLDSKAKWEEDSAEFKGSKAVMADKLEPELLAKLQKTALDAYRALRVRDYGRIDMRLTASGEIYVIEVNASCYLEQTSEFAMSAAAGGIDYPQLVGKIVDLALERDSHRRKVRPKSE